MGEGLGGPRRSHKVKGDEHMVSHLHMPNSSVHTKGKG